MSSRSSRGFVHLGGDSNNDMDNIQLTPVRSNASSTGQRKVNTNNSSTTFGSRPENEKSNPDQTQAGRRRRRDHEGLRRHGTGSDEVKLNAMGRLYYKIINFSAVTRYLVYVVPIGILLAIPLIVLPLVGHKHDIFLGSHQKADKATPDNGPTLFKLFEWIEITWLTLWLAKIVALFLPAAFMFFCGVVSTGTRKYATVLGNLIIPISIFLWALATWLTFKNLFQDAQSKDIEWVKTMNRILGACFVSSAIFLGEKALVQLIGITYHQRSFALRIKDSKREIHLLGLLFDASRTLFPMYCSEFIDEDYIINDSIQAKLRGKQRHKRGGSVTPMKLIGDVGRIGDKVTSVFGNIAHEITGKQVFNPNSAHSIVLEALEKHKPSEALARRIWMSFVVEDKDALYLEDFEEVLGPAFRDEAEEAFNAIDNDLNGDISLDEMVRKVTEMGKERKAIAEGMKDIGQALQVFDKILLFAVLLIVIFVFRKFLGARISVLLH